MSLLQELAKEIYREWFVRFRFPGHNVTKVIKGIPSGWTQAPLPLLTNITYGFVFDGARFNTEGRGKPIIRIRNIPDSDTFDYTDEPAHDKYVVHQGDLLVGMDGEFHINHWSGEEAYLVQRVCRLKAKSPELQGYLSHAVHAPIKHFESILMGATVGHLGARDLNSIKLLVPPKHLHAHLQVFNDIDRQRLLLAIGARTLANNRDLLLSRLLSGRMSVESLDIHFRVGMTDELALDRTAASHA